MNSTQPTAKIQTSMEESIHLDRSLLVGFLCKSWWQLTNSYFGEGILELNQFLGRTMGTCIAAFLFSFAPSSDVLLRFIH
jgi:hypothetical protein